MTNRKPPPHLFSQAKAEGKIGAGKLDDQHKSRLLHDGDILASGTYEVERFLAEGAFGEVYRVRHRFLGRLAMKVFKLANVPIEEVHALLSEAFLLSRIAHPNIISVFDAGLVPTSLGECPYFTMEYIAGGTLHDYWKSFGAAFIPVEKTVEIMAQVCSGLRVAHGHTPPVVHRDIKPHNILVGYDGLGLRVRIADFGLAKRVNPLTLTVTAHGTLPFKAPEIFNDVKGDSCAGDIWAVGCTYYLLLTDRLPWRGQLGHWEEPASQTNGFIPPSHFNTGVDAELDLIISRALAWEPGQRYPNANAMLADLEKWQPAPPKVAKEEFDSSTMMKTALGPVTSLHPKEASALIEQALKLAKDPRKLIEAADLLEEALKDLPSLRDRYGYRVQLWRRGLMM